MKRRNLLLLGLVCIAAVFAGQAHGNAVEEVKRLAALMEWKPGTVAADIGAGDGEYTFRAVERVGETQAGKREGGREQRSGHQSADRLLRRDFSKACVPSPDQTDGVRCQPGAVVEERRAAGDY